MCGIVGYTGNHQAAPVLLYGLSKLEYRGYDSAGLAVRDGDGETDIIKAKGRLKVLADKTNDGESVPGTCGIGHTRWATHGEPSVFIRHISLHLPQVTGYLDSQVKNIILLMIWTRKHGMH